MTDEKQKSEAKMEEDKDKKMTDGAKEKTEEKKKEQKETPKIMRKPKTEAVVNSFNAHLSAKTSGAVCRFIVGKTIDQAVSDLNEVARGKKVVPMRGEIPHKKGKGIMAGRYPKNAAEHFITLLKTLSGNAQVNNLEEPVIVEAFANIGQRPYGRFGAVRRKRSHIKIIAKNKVKKPEKK
ncbi:MAG: uL22 family ribosomal protein [Candidatus Nanoarchaeia archaeon]|nr:uL22 family ribosomal protein [Candidatus Nanoarchaeia archaeon]